MHLHRSMPTANDALWPLETAQTSPIITTTEVEAKKMDAGGVGGAQRGSLCERRRALYRGSLRSHYKPPPGSSGC